MIVFNRSWDKLNDGNSRTEGGHWLMEVQRNPPPGPGVVSMGGFSTSEKLLNPNLIGTNGVEITVVDFSHEDYDRKLDEPGQLVQAWSMTVGSWQGCVGGQKDEQQDRGVQLHFDLLRNDGLYVYLVRGLLPEDFAKYPQDGFGRADSKEISDKELWTLHVDTSRLVCPYVTALFWRWRLGFSALNPTSRLYSENPDVTAST